MLVFTPIPDHLGNVGKDRTQQKAHVSHQLIKLKALPTNLRLKE
jgi:hypothetical protein